MAVFPDLKVVDYRLDIPRDCTQLVSQKLNGYGPWVWSDTDGAFEETGRPLVTKEWDVLAVKTMLQKGILPPLDTEVDVISDEQEYGVHSRGNLQKRRR